MSAKVFTGSNFGLVPESTYKRNFLEQKIITTLNQYGFREVTVPLYEYYDVLKNVMKNLKDGHIISFPNKNNGKMLALRPDFTPQVSRMLAGYHKDYPMPVRLSYKGSIFRNVDVDKGIKAEKYQVGCELYGAKELDGDIELFLCLKASLENMNIFNYSFIVGDAKFISRIGELLGEQKEEYLNILNKKQIDKHIEYVSSLKISDELRKLLSELPRMFGGIEVLSELKHLVEFDEVLKNRHMYIDRMFNLLANLNFKTDNLVFDLSDTRGINYYTGMVFDVIHNHTGLLIGGGGRYDTLMNEFRLKYTACGMALYLSEIENIEELDNNFKDEEIDWVVVGIENLSKAEKLRSEGFKVIYLSDSDELETFSSVISYKNLLITT